MNTKSFGHLSFNCKNLKKSVEFYCEALGFEQKFSLHYSDFIDSMKSYSPNIPKFVINFFEKRKNRVWITYLEISNGVFIELFDQIGAVFSHRSTALHRNYQHFALIVDDIQEKKKKLISKGIEIDIDISLGSDNTYQMWIHDPDGNKIEIMQYTENSLQLVNHS